MTTYSFVSTDLAKPRATETVKYDLTIRQQPEQAKVCTVKERDRRPIDPPPIIQLHVVAQDGQVPNYLQNPHLFMCATLIHATEDRPLANSPSTILAGTTVSSLYRLKDSDNTEGGFFVFADTSVKMEGSFRLKLSLFELRTTPDLPSGLSQQVTHLVSVCTQPFTVFSSKGFPGMLPSTFMSKSFSDQGVRIRIRKENRMTKSCDDPLTLRAREGLADHDTESTSFSVHRSPDSRFVYSPQSVDFYPEPYRQPSGISPTSSSCPSRSERLSPKSYHPYMFQPVSPKLLHHAQQQQQQQQSFPEPLKFATKHQIWRPVHQGPSARPSVSPRDSSTGFHPNLDSSSQQFRELPSSYIPYGDHQSSTSSELSRRVSSNSTKSAVLPSPPDHFGLHNSIVNASTSAPQEFRPASVPSSMHNYEKVSPQLGYGASTSRSRGQPNDYQMHGDTLIQSRPRIYDGLEIAEDAKQSHGIGLERTYDPAFKSPENAQHRFGSIQPSEASYKTSTQSNHNFNGMGLRLPPIQSSISEPPFQSSNRQPYVPPASTSMHHIYRY